MHKYRMFCASHLSFSKKNLFQTVCRHSVFRAQIKMTPGKKSTFIMDKTLKKLLIYRGRTSEALLLKTYDVKDQTPDKRPQTALSNFYDFNTF